MKKRYPIGIQSFEKLRKENYLYVDKTELVYELATTGSYYFLSRPRRFGKSMLISTLEAYFLGQKELFEGLAMVELEKEWITYPVLHLDLNAEKYDRPESLYNILNDTLAKWERLYGTEPSEVSLSLRFRGIVGRAHEKTGQQVVILVDEYDKPMLQAINNPELQEDFRNTLKAFYGVLKSMDRSIRFALLTGVTKFGKVSVFSDLNNLKDISMDDRYAQICGLTEKEIHHYLEPELHLLAEKCGVTYEEVCRDLKDNYDGYHFVENSVGMYNPFSILNTFDSMKFGNYWFETGTPTYLVELLKRSDFYLPDLDRIETDADTLNSIDSMSYDPVPVIYQSGYLTIKGYDSRFGMFRLGFPNTEVREGFVKYLIPFYTSVSKEKSAFHIMHFIREIESGDYDSFFRRLQSFLADIPYDLHADATERHYQNILFIVCKLLGCYVQAEYHSSYGREDMVLKTDKFIYVMEFKLNGSVDAALKQIEEKKYALPYESDGRKIFRIGVNFDTTQHNILEWKAEE